MTQLPFELVEVELVEAVLAASAAKAVEAAKTKPMAKNKPFFILSAPDFFYLPFSSGKTTRQKALRLINGLDGMFK
jgi:hypothetical protein